MSALLRSFGMEFDERNVPVGDKSHVRIDLQIIFFVANQILSMRSGQTWSSSLSIVHKHRLDFIEPQKLAAVFVGSSRVRYLLHHSQNFQ
jgi:hypothetical protein